MARYRCIEPDLWRNRFLRRSGMVVREVFTYCFSALADDEGRFEWHPDKVLDEAFGRDDPVDEGNVSAAMDALSSEGMLVRYGEHGEFGFVSGWFQHQVIDSRNRHESACPRPPVVVGSWKEADEARKQYASERGIDLARALYRDAIRWLRDKHASSTSEALVDHAPEGKGREVEGKGSTALTLHAEAEACHYCGKQHKAKDPSRMGVEEKTLNRAFEAMTGQRLSCVRVAIVENQKPKADGTKPNPLHGITGLIDLIGATDDALIDELLSHPNCPRLPDSKKPWPWFSKTFRDSINRPWDWRNKGDNGRESQPPSFLDLPSDIVALSNPRGHQDVVAAVCTREDFVALRACREVWTKFPIQFRRACDEYRQDHNLPLE